jgi:lysozyme family protein
MKGVIQRVYNSYRRNKQMGPRSVELLTQAELEDIYRTMYWNQIRGDSLPVGLDYCVFDFAVNSGPSRAIKFLQKAINKVGTRTIKVDGLMGPATLDAATTYPPEELISRICDDRLSWVQTLKIWATFGKGWGTRIKGVKRDALKMVPFTGLTVSKPEVPEALGLPGDVKPTELSLVEKVSGAALGGGASFLGAVSNPYTLTFALVLVAIGAAYLFWKFRK